jgi:quercetin dioxygenase-like cupin family protein
MDQSRFFPLTGVVPAVCDSEAGDLREIRSARVRHMNAPDIPQPRNFAMKLLTHLVPAIVIAAGSFAAPLANASPEAVATPLMTKPLPDYPGKEGLMLLVEYPPGSVDPVHRHDAHAFIYVLEGSIVMQVKGGKEVTLTRGQTFYEAPNDVHLVGRNASTTQPAKFLVVFLKKEGAPVLTPVK